MDEVTMDDGLDGPEALVLGLGAPETAALVVALLGAWAGIAVLPAWVGWPGGGLLVATGAALGWGRYDDRALLAWALLAARFGWRRRRALRSRVVARVCGAAGVVVQRVPRRPTGPRAAPRRGVPEPPAAGDREDLVVPLGLPRLTGPAPAGGARVVGFFSLCGGSGRSTLACALAARLATDGRLPARHGWRPLRVALLDLDATLPGASLRWGAPLGGRPRSHVSGAVIHAAVLDGGDEPVHRLARVATDADVVVVDARWHEPGGVEVLRRCDDIVVVVTPTPRGVLDGYRSVAWLRRVGVRDRLLLVANRCDAGADLGELEDDLGLRVVARVRISDDMEGDGAVASLAALINQRLLGAAVADVAAEAG